MHPWTRSTIPAVVLVALAALPAAAGAQTPTRAAAPQAAPVVEAKYVLEAEGGVGTTFVDKQKWSGTISPLSDWNTTAYAGNARLFFARLGSLRIGAEAGYNYFWWYTTGAAGTPYTYGPHATRVGPVVRAGLGRRMAVDGGAAAYIFPGGTDYGVNAALGYFIPVGRQLSLPIKVRGDLVFDPSTTLASVLMLVGLSYRF
jgi:hypothetical protein